MVYVYILGNGKRSECVISEAKKFRSLKAAIEYCWKLSKKDSVTVEYAADNSFDYYMYV